MKRLLCITFGLLLGLSARGAQFANPAATVDRDIYGDTWFPEWNTEGSPQGWGWRNTAATDPNPATWSAVGKTLKLVKNIGDLGEDRWNTTAILVFADDASGQSVRFGMWTSPGGGAGRGNQTISFAIPDWARGEIRFEVWASYGAASNITNWQYNPATGTWTDHFRKSHLAVFYGDSGIRIENIPPDKPFLTWTPSAPGGSLTPSASAIDLGGSVVLTVATSDGDAAHTSLTGGGVNITNPPNSVTVTPPGLGTSTYTLTVPPVATLHFTPSLNGDKLMLQPPTGPAINVTAMRTFTAYQSGTYSLTEYNANDVASEPDVAAVTLGAPFTVAASISVSQPSAVVSVTPTSATYTVHDGLAAGHTYLRSWSDGAGWNAYLGRDGVLINVSATGSDAGIAQIELQAKTPTGDWADLLPVQTIESSIPNGAGVPVSQTYSVKLGTTRPDKPLIPSDSSLVGGWQLRARVFTTSGHWSNWSTPSALNVQLPLTTVTQTGQTLPPVEDSAWYTASDVRTYTYQVWIP